MANLNVAVVISGQDQGASSVLTQVTTSLSSMAAMAGGAVAVAMGGILRDALEGAASAVANFVGQAAQAELQQAGLVAALNSTGMAATLTQSTANALAMQFRDLAGGSDEAIAGIEEIGIRSGQITATEMPRFIQDTLDLGTEMHNTAGAAQLLARAQDDPVGAFTRLERQTGVYDIALKNNIATMVKHGDVAGATAAIMDYVARVTGGAAAAAADTLSGKWSVLTNHFDDFFKTLSGPVVAAIENLLDVANPTLDGVYSKFENTFLPLITDAAAWGQAIVEVLAEGMQSAFGLVVEVINQLGNLIASFMAPGSPPRFLPLLDVWGRQAVDVYLKGWTTFDKSVFDEIGTAIKAGLPAAEIQEYADTMHQLANANQAVADAQNALNDVTEHYDELINPLNAKLKGLENQQQVINDQATIAKLQAIQSDTGYSDDQKKAAAIEIQKIQLKEQIAGLELEKATAVDGAKAKLTAAQEAAAALKTQADQLKTQIDIQAEMTKQINVSAGAVSSLHHAVGGLAGAFDAAGGAAGGMKDKIDSAMDTLKTNIANKAAEIKTAIEGKFADVQAYIAGLFAPGGIFAPIGAALTQVRGWWDDHHLQVFTAVKGAWDAIENWTRTSLAELGTMTQTALNGVKGWWDNHHLQVFTAIKNTWNAIENWTRTSLAELGTMTQTALNGIKGWWDQHGQSVLTILNANWTALLMATKLGSFLVGFVIEAWLGNLREFWDIWGGLIKALWDAFWTGLGDVLDIAADILSGKWDKLWDDLKKYVSDSTNSIIGIVNAMVDAIKRAVSDALAALAKLAGAQGGGGGVNPAGNQYAAGLDTVIPPGFPHDSFPLGALGWAESGERVTITPAGEPAPSGAAGLVINIDARGSTDPAAVEAAGYRGAKRALRESGLRSDQLARLGIH